MIHSRLLLKSVLIAIAIWIGCLLIGSIVLAIRDYPVLLPAAYQGKGTSTETTEHFSFVESVVYIAGNTAFITVVLPIILMEQSSFEGLVNPMVILVVITLYGFLPLATGIGYFVLKVKKERVS